MRHAVRGRKFARTSAHRLAMRRNLVQSLIEHGQIRTTIQKAKEVRGFAEKAFGIKRLMRVNPRLPQSADEILGIYRAAY